MFQAFLVLALAWPASVGWAAENQDAPSTLNVSAKGKIQVAPDTAMVNFAVETAGESFEQVVGENRDRMKAVKEALFKLNIPEERIQTTTFDVTPRYAPQPRPRPGDPIRHVAPKIIGYTARNGLKVEVHDLEKVGAVVDRALSAGANQFQGIHWTLRDRHPVYLQALGQAAKKAKEKASVLAQALDVHLLELLTVQEGGAQGPAPRQAFAKARMLMSDAAEASSVPLSPGEISIEAQVALLYAIGPSSGIMDVP